MMRNVLGLASTLAAALALSCAVQAAEKRMSGAELSALLANGKTVKLGGPGEGYSGELVLSADGKGSGSAKTDGGTVIKIEGAWAVKGDKFCRTWSGLDDGKEICETWVLVGTNKVHVMNGKKKVGVNHW
jgi:hypothetical protein